MAKINVRSPYFAQVGTIGLTSATLEMLIYTGVANTTWQGSPQYTLSTTGTTGKINFEISELIRDYIPAAFDGVYPSVGGSSTDSTTVYVDYKITGFVGTTAQTPIYAFGLRAFYGYGYFEDGSNPEFVQGYLQSNNVILKKDDAPIRIPVDNENTNSVAFFYQGQQVYSWLPSTGLNIQDQIVYISNGVNGADSFEERVELDGGTFEDNSCIDQFEEDFELHPVDTVYVSAADGLTIIKVDNIEECKYTPYKVTFINKFGAYQDIWFFKRSNLSMTKKDEMFKSNLMGTAGSMGYATNRHQYSTFHVNAKETLSLNTGFYPESYNEVFRQMSLSDKIWIEYNEKTLPVRLTSSNLSFKTRLDDKLINYTIELEFAFDKINNVR
jgi:hypothetical protein